MPAPAPGASDSAASAKNDATLSQNGNPFR
jgi:hypothetical protein